MSNIFHVCVTPCRSIYMYCLIFFDYLYIILPTLPTRNALIQVLHIVYTVYIYIIFLLKDTVASCSQ